MNDSHLDKDKLFLALICALPLSRYRRLIFIIACSRLALDKAAFR